MMKLYKYTFGEWVNYGPAKDDADAFERRIAIDPQFHYVPVTIEEVKLEGYEIVVNYERRNELLEKQADIIKAMNKDELKDLLKQKEVEFHHMLGEDKLKELALQHI